MYNPDLVSYSPGFVPPGQQYQHAYLSPSHHFPGGDGNYHDSYAPNMTPQHNDHWQRQQSQQQQQQQQQQPSVVINDGTASDGGSPAPRTSVAWGPTGVSLPLKCNYMYLRVTITHITIRACALNYLLHYIQRASFHALSICEYKHVL